MPRPSLAGEERIPPPDGGWGWMVVIGCALVHVLMGGLLTVYGLFLMALIEKFEQSAAVTAWVGSLMIAIGMCFSPVSTILSNRLSPRLVVMLGGFLMGLGCILSSLAPNLYYLFFTYSIVAGSGLSLVYAPSIVMVSQYFEKRRALAMGLGTCGLGIGALILPPLTELLLETYGYFGAMLIMGAVLMNICVSGALYRPLRRPRPTKTSTVDNRAGEVVQEEDDPMIEERGAFLVKSAETTDKSRNSEVAVSIKKSSCLGSCCGARNTQQRPLLDIHIFRELSFDMYCLTILYFVLCYATAVMLLPAYAKEKGVDPKNSAFLLSIIGIVDTAVRIGIGFLVDLKSVKPHRRHLFTAAVLVSGLGVLCFVFAQTYVELVIVCVVHGLARGIVISQQPVILGDLIGGARMAQSYGFVIMFQGIAALTGPPVAGVLMDKTGSFDVSFYFLGIVGMLAAPVFLLEFFIQRGRGPRTLNPEKQTEQKRTTNH